VKTNVEVVPTPQGLELRHTGARRGVRLNLEEVEHRLRQGGALALARACGARPGLAVLDVMAGLGFDAVLLACLGCTVTAVERSPSVYRVLVDGVARAARHFALQGTLRCVAGDGLELLAAGQAFEVVYLDPMFPGRRKGALPKLRAQVLADAAVPLEFGVADLIERARLHAIERVVLKRRARDPVAAVPDWQIRGERIRFDVYRGCAGSGGSAAPPDSTSALGTS
jgi:16S rRNA (guanine1516-N2)-methyltransferase